MKITTKNRCGRCLSMFTFLLLMLFVSANFALAQTMVPVNGVTPPVVAVTINASAGDQSNPQVSGDWAVYTSELTIRYYNFVTGVDAEIPMGPSSRDILSGISGSKIVFSRIISGVKTSVVMFDASTPAVAR